MKRILYSVCIASLAMAVTAWGAHNNQSFGGGKKARRAATVQGSSSSSVSHRAMIRPGRVSTARSFQTTRFRPRTYKMTAQGSSNAVIRRNALRSRIHTSQALSARSSNQSFRAQKGLAVNRGNQHLTVNQAKNLNRTGNFNMNRGRNFNGKRNAGIVNNWRGERFSGQKYAAFRNYNRQSHNRDWWHHHCSRVIFIGGGWWGWNAGYWFPAWGYDPYYTYYPFDGPIYTGVADLSPDQVVVNVQQQLQQDGYYAGPIDGVLGPLTRAAIANYQADHGLAITSAVDEPTLETMGLT